MWDQSLLAVFYDSAIWPCYIGYKMRIMRDFYSWWRIWKTLKYRPRHDYPAWLSSMTVLHDATFYWTHTTSYNRHTDSLVKSLNTTSWGSKLIMRKPSLFISISLNFIPIKQANENSYHYCWASIIPHIDKLYPSSFEQWSKVMCLIALNSPHILGILAVFITSSQ